MSPDTRIRMNILLIDDDPDILQSIGDYLRGEGHRVYQAKQGEEGLEILRREAVDIVIADIVMPGMNGFEVLREVKRTSPEVEVIMVTAYGDIDAAVRAMREGAFDFFTKPVKMRELSASLERAVHFHALRQEKDRYRERLDRLDTEAQQRYGLSAIIGESPAIRAVKGLIQQVCRTEATTVLIWGETGTGKELVARAIHTESARAGGPFVAVDCSAIPESLMESELYGHVKGAFTDARESRAGRFELADGGTLFLDENRGYEPGDADAAAAHAGGTARPAGGRVERGPGERARGVGHEPGPGEGDLRGAVPGGPLPQAEYLHHLRSAAAGAAGGHSAAGPALSGTV